MVNKFFFLMRRTLIELLVVIAILAAMLLPALSQASEKSGSAGEKDVSENVDYFKNVVLKHKDYILRKGPIAVGISKSGALDVRLKGVPVCESSLWFLWERMQAEGSVVIDSKSEENGKMVLTGVFFGMINFVETIEISSNSINVTYDLKTIKEIDKGTVDRIALCIFHYGKDIKQWDEKAGYFYSKSGGVISGPLSDKVGGSGWGINSIDSLGFTKVLDRYTVKEDVLFADHTNIEPSAPDSRYNNEGDNFRFRLYPEGFGTGRNNSLPEGTEGKVGIEFNFSEVTP